MIAKTTFTTKNKNKLDIIDKNLSPCRRRSRCQIRCWLHPTRCRCCGPAPPSPAAEPRPELWNTKHRHTPLLSNQNRTRRLLLTSCWPAAVGHSADVSSSRWWKYGTSFTLNAELNLKRLDCDSCHRLISRVNSDIVCVYVWARVSGCVCNNDLLVISFMWV